MSDTDIVGELHKKLQNKRKGKSGNFAPEKTIMKSAMESLNRLRGCVCMKYHGSVYGVAGHADLYGCYNGKSFFIEMKVPGEKPTTLQYNFLKKVREAGALAGWATSANQAVMLVTGNVPQQELE